MATTPWQRPAVLFPGLPSELVDRVLGGAAPAAPFDSSRCKTGEAATKTNSRLVLLVVTTWSLNTNC